MPAGFDAWFEQAVARDKLARFQSIKEAVDVLARVCGRPSGRPSVVSIPAERGDTALSPRAVAPAAAAGSRKAVGLQTTGAPSSRSIPGLSRPSRSTLTFAATVVTALVIIMLYAGWRWTQKSDVARSAASIAASAPPIALPSPSVAEPAQAAPAVPPIVLASPVTAAPAPSNVSPLAMTQGKAKSTGPANHQKSEGEHPAAPALASASAATAAPARSSSANPFATRK